MCGEMQYYVQRYISGISPNDPTILHSRHFPILVGNKDFKAPSLLATYILRTGQLWAVSNGVSSQMTLA